MDGRGLPGPGKGLGEEDRSSSPVTTPPIVLARLGAPERGWASLGWARLCMARLAKAWPGWAWLG
jgi:hypothetical protein